MLLDFLASFACLLFRVICLLRFSLFYRRILFVRNFFLFLLAFFFMAVGRLFLRLLDAMACH